MRNTTSQEYSPIEHLAQVLGLFHDGGDDDRIFDDGPVHVDSLSMNRREYNAMEKAINKFEIKGNGFIVYTWNDGSGYDYWNLGQEEDNYIQLTAVIEDPLNLNVDELNHALELGRVFVSTYSKY